MNNSKIELRKILPVFMSFIVMGFVDIIGVATGYVKQDFKLTDFVAQFLPMMVLLWFFVLSVPAGVLQDKYRQTEYVEYRNGYTGYRPGFAICPLLLSG